MMTIQNPHSLRPGYGSFLQVVAWLFIATLLSSCSEKAVKDHDQLSIQLLTQAFDAVHAREHDLAAARLAKVDAEERSFLNKLITREKEAAVLKSITELLEKGDYEKASETAEKGLIECGHTPQMTHARRVVNGLSYIKDYKKKRPFTDPDTADSAVNGLPQPKLFGNHRAYVTWLNQQKKDRDALLQNVRREKAAGLMSELDSLILRERGNYGLVLKKLNSVIPDHPLYKSVTAQKPDDNLSQEEMELYQMIRFKKNPSDTWVLPRDHAPKTLSGRYLMVAGHLKEGNRLAALAMFRDVLEKEPQLDPMLIREFMVSSKLKPDGIAPTATSALNTLYFFQR